MGILYSSYYGFIRVNEAGPQVKNWAATDTNWDELSIILKGLEQHQHGGATPIFYPGFNYATPATPLYPTVSQGSPGGFLSPGTIVGVRLAYINSQGLETAGSPEIDIAMPTVPERADAPQLGVPQATPVIGAVGGGTYVYGLTKRQGTGETMLSNTSVIDVPFSPAQSYTVGLTFDNIGSYGDSTDSLLVYRAEGYNSAFQLLGIITDPNQTTYIDSNIILNSAQSPPPINQFQKNNYVNINWSSFHHPASAIALKVYVTQTPALWGTRNLLMQWPMNDPSTPLPTGMQYLGNEILGQDYPKEFSQIPGSPPKIYLTNQAYGAPILTENMNFSGFKANNFVLANNINNATPISGAMYYEPTMSTPAVRAYLGPYGWQTLVPAGGTYSHPAQEQGGHSTDNIVFNKLGGPTLTQILSSFATPVPKWQMGATDVFKATATPVNLTTMSSAATSIPDMTITVNPNFAGNWVNLDFNGHFYLDTAGATATIQLLVNGISQQETVRSWTAALNGQSNSFGFTFATPISQSNTVYQVQWWTSGGTLTSIGPRRTLIGSALF